MRTTTHGYADLPHPGESMVPVYLDPNNLSGCELAANSEWAASTLNRILTGMNRINLSRSKRREAS